MEDIDSQIAACAAEEQELQLASFSNSDGLALGNAIVERAIAQGKRVTVNVERHGVILFHHAMEGMSPDNDEWVARKKRVVNRFSKSSLHMTLLLKKSGRTIQERYQLDPALYAASGGAFPLIIRGTGVVGAVAASGLTQEEDHELVVSVLRSYLSRKK